MQGAWPKNVKNVKDAKNARKYKNTSKSDAKEGPVGVARRVAEECKEYKKIIQEYEQERVSDLAEACLWVWGDGRLT